MPTYLRFLCHVLGLAGSLAVLLWVGPYNLSHLGRNWQAFREWCQEQECETRREADLTRKRDILARRIAGKRQVAQQVIARELTLVEAAAWFRFLNETPEDFPDPACDTPGKSLGEKQCRMVIRWVAAELRDQGATRLVHEEIRRLESELHQQERTDGTVILPDL
jgi:hypothetical protein